MLTRLTLALVPIVALTGCYEPDGGDRAVSGDCPAGEICNPTTPNGLYFTGTPWTDCFLSCDPGVKTTAIGGTQTITVLTGANSSSAVFTQPFAVDSFGNGVSVDSVSPPDFVIRGESSSWTEVSVVDGQGRLYDKIDLFARPLRDISIRAPLGDLLGGGEDGWVAWAAGGASIIATLTGTNGSQLADESLGMALAGEPDGVYKTAWNRVALRPIAAGEHTLEISQNGDVHSFGITAVDEVHDIASSNLGAEPSEPFPAQQPQTFCFQAYHLTDVIVGIEIGFSIVGEGVTITPALFKNCIEITGQQAGPAILDVFAGDLRYAIALEIVAAESASARTRPFVPDTSDVVAVPGMRAAGN